MARGRVVYYLIRFVSETYKHSEGRGHGNQLIAVSMTKCTYRAFS